MVLSAVRADPDRRRHRLCGGCGDPRAGRHDLAGDALAAAAAAFRPRAGRQRVDRGVRGPGDRGAHRDVPPDVAEPQLPADGRRQAGAGVARDPARDLGDPQRLHRQAGVGNGMVRRGAEHPRPARSGGGNARLVCDRDRRPAADAAAADQGRRAADRGAVADQHRQQLHRKPDYPRHRPDAVDPGAAGQDHPHRPDGGGDRDRARRRRHQPFGARGLLPARPASASVSACRRSSPISSRASSCWRTSR